MAGDAALARAAVSVRLRRVAAGRPVQRLLVLAGLLIAGWLLGCAAQSAHADELPPARVVAATPVLADAVTTVHEHEPVRQVVHAVAQKAPRAEQALPAAPLPAPNRQVRPPAGHQAAPHASEVVPVMKVHRQALKPAFSHVSRTRPSVGHASSHVVRHRPAPLPTPDRPGPHSAGGGAVIASVTAGFPASWTWTPAPPRTQRPTVFGALPPVVRTAADEPSFAPD